MENENIDSNNSPISQNETSIDFSKLNNSFEEVKKSISNIIIGKSETTHLMMIALLSNGHMLLEGVPGIAKTLSAKLIAKSLDTDFKRIQFTPDLMPSDVLGTNIYNNKTQDFEYKKGPAFTNILLIDEINRAPAKTQAALFEVMEERQITMDGVTYPMAFPFIVLATQNPIEQEGTYRLPEAQMDRFMFKLELDYPNLKDEVQVIKNHNSRQNQLNLNDIPKLISAKELKEYQELTQKIQVKDSLIEYLVSIVNKTRNHPAIEIGASPRASISILEGAKASAALDNRDYVNPEDIKFIAPFALNHRIILSPEKEMEGISTTKIAQDIVNSIEVPR